MVDVDTMSDAELRAKLLEFGFPVMPITGTTRKVMAKKLKLLLENKNKVGKDNRRSLGRYSSEEESDSDLKPAKNKYKRATLAAPLMQPPPSGKVAARKSARFDAPSPISDVAPKKEIKTTTTTTRTTKILQNCHDDYDDGSESDEIAERFASPKSNDSSKKSGGDSSFGGRSFGSPGRLPPSFLSASTAADAAADRLTQIRSRLSTYSSGYDRPLYTSSPTVEERVNEKENTPFLSNFTKRLSQLAESPRTTYDYKSDIIKENDVNGSGATSRTYLNSYRAARGRPSYNYPSTNQGLFKNNFVPFIVLIVACLFFIVVTMVYLGIRSESGHELTATVPICVKTDLTTRRYVNCVLEGEGKGALNLMKVLRPELAKRAVINLCTDRQMKPYMTDNDVISFVKSNYATQNETRIATDLTNLQVLTFFNPAWGLSVIQTDREDARFVEDMVAGNMEEVVRGKHNKVTGLIVLSPYVPWSCYLYNKASAVFSILTSVAGGLIILYVINYAYKYYKQFQQKQQEEEVAIVENIIDILQSNSSENEDNYLVINHVRDMILPINERKSKEKTWISAVKYINENESRIRTEVQVVRGEPSEVWRWLGGPNLSSSKNKSWQGQAFETQVGSVNSLSCSPTPCLKIRGMVEDGDRNTHVIKKAVLNKCANQCRILHCAVDTNSNCVYLKCADPNDAAVAYRNLHGWWYAGNLVTVKYLRLERYMQRFPDSPAAGPPFLQ